MNQIIGNSQDTLSNDDDDGDDNGDQAASDGRVFNEGVTASGMVSGPLAVEDEVFDHN